MSEYFFEIEQLILEFIAKTKALNECMQADQHFFSNNDFAAIEVSDLKKVEIQSSLSECIGHLISHPAIKISYGDLFVKLSYYAGTLNASYQSTLLNLIQNMREESMIGTKLLMINRQVVNANLSHIKEIIGHLTHSPTNSSNITYNNSAELA